MAFSQEKYLNVQQIALWNSLASRKVTRMYTLQKQMGARFMVGRRSVENSGGWL